MKKVVPQRSTELCPFNSEPLPAFVASNQSAKLAVKNALYPAYSQCVLFQPACRLCQEMGVLGERLFEAPQRVYG